MTDRLKNIIILAAGALAAGLLWLAEQHTVPLCPFRHLWGVPCPGCGGTRALGLLMRGFSDWLSHGWQWLCGWLGVGCGSSGVGDAGAVGAESAHSLGECIVGSTHSLGYCVAEALWLNPLAVLLIFAGIAIGVWLAIDIVRGARSVLSFCERILSHPWSPHATWLIISALLLNWIWIIANFFRLYR